MKSNICGQKLLLNGNTCLNIGHKKYNYLCKLHHEIKKETRIKTNKKTLSLGFN
jgi:hypothetical protein